jgi:hypothetical protein
MEFLYATFKTCMQVSPKIINKKAHLRCRRLLLDCLISFLLSTRVLAVRGRFIHVLNVLLVSSPIVRAASLSLVNRLHARLVAS